MHCNSGGVHDDLVDFYAALWGRRGGQHHRAGGCQDGKDFFIGDINIELRLEGGGEDTRGVGSFDWHGPCGPECPGGGEDVVTYEKNTLAAIKGFTSNSGNR